ncbi:MAG: hypothetical protein WBX81_07455, partial [Nitrososphaeraceae archaeon]
MALEESGNEFLHVIISLAILLFTAKIFAEIFHRLKMPVVLGELLAGIIIGPFAIGGLIFFDGEPLVVLDAAIVDDILAIAVLSVVTTMVQTGDTSPQIMDVIFLILQIL